MSDAGRVVHVNLLKDDQGKSKGRAIVTYNRPEVGGRGNFRLIFVFFRKRGER